MHPRCKENCELESASSIIQLKTGSIFFPKYDRFQAFHANPHDALLDALIDNEFQIRFTETFVEVSLLPFLIPRGQPEEAAFSSLPL